MRLMQRPLALVWIALLCWSGTAAAQSASRDDDRERRPATTTVAGDTGLWFLPTGVVLPARKVSLSLYRTNMDDGQGFTDMSTFPLTVAVGVGGRAEIFGNWSVVTRVDRDARPLFFTSTAAADADGTGGGIVPNYPLVRREWIGSRRGDLWLGAKVNLLPPSQSTAFALRGQVKLPVGDDANGASSGKADVAFDGVVSSEVRRVLELTGYGGVIVRGNPAGYTLTNGLRWGVGAGLPSRWPVRGQIELFGERYNSLTITAPAGLVGSDGSAVPTTTHLKRPVFLNLGLTAQAPNGFFIGVAGLFNLHMSTREEAQCAVCPVFENESFDRSGFQIRIGYHPGVRKTGPPVVPSPPPPAAPSRPEERVTPPTPPATPPRNPPVVAAPPVTPPPTPPPTAPPVVPPPTPPRTAPPVAPPPTAPVTPAPTGPPARSYQFEDIYFDFDGYTLRPEAMRILDDAVAAMKADRTLRLDIEGYTCDIATTQYNMALGEKRARSVKDYLVNKGVEASRLRTISYGEERPKYDNSREETRRLNRRASLVVNLMRIDD